MLCADGSAPELCRVCRAKPSYDEGKMRYESGIPEFFIFPRERNAGAPVQQPQLGGGMTGTRAWSCLSAVTVVVPPLL